MSICEIGAATNVGQIDAVGRKHAPEGLVAPSEVSLYVTKFTM